MSSDTTGRPITFYLGPDDQDLLNWLDQQPGSRSAVIREVIRQAVERDRAIDQILIAVREIQAHLAGQTMSPASIDSQTVGGVSPTVRANLRRLVQR